MYVGFFVDMTIEVIGLVFYFAVIITAGSLFSGLCLYITGMVDDVGLQIALLDNNQSNQMNAAERRRAREVYVNEIRFHIKIIEYAGSL